MRNANSNKLEAVKKAVVNMLKFDTKNNITCETIAMENNMSIRYVYEIEEMAVDILYYAEEISHDREKELFMQLHDQNIAIWELKEEICRLKKRS